jgi:mono/diheme cytochrome c family protein
MRKVLKWIGIFLGGLIGLLLLAAVFVTISSNARLNKTYDIPPDNVTVHNNDEVLARGQHLFEIGCADCHAADLSGGTIIDEPPVASIFTSNLTAGDGGIGQSYSDADWVRAIRHGVTPDGTPLLVMPSQVYYYYSDEDVAAIVAYAKSAPPVDKKIPEKRLGPVGRALFTAGMLPAPAAELVDHTGPRPIAPEPGVTAAYGEYIAGRGCTDCHGANYAGGVVPGSPPDTPPAPNLTPAGNLAGWSEDDFIATIRSGFTPEGHQLESKEMPWPTYGKMTDEELQAVWLFLQALPAKQS